MEFFQFLKTSNKLGALSELEKRNRMASKKISYQQITMLLLFFQFMAILDQSGGQMPVARSIILNFFIDKLEKEVVFGTIKGYIKH